MAEAPTNDLARLIGHACDEIGELIVFENRSRLVFQHAQEAIVRLHALIRDAELRGTPQDDLNSMTQVSYFLNLFSPSSFLYTKILLFLFDIP